jgi:hypothetical protein
VEPLHALDADGVVGAGQAAAWTPIATRGRREIVPGRAGKADARTEAGDAARVVDDAGVAQFVRGVEVVVGGAGLAGDVPGAVRRAREAPRHHSAALDAAKGCVEVVPLFALLADDRALAADAVADHRAVPADPSLQKVVLNAGDAVGGRGAVQAIGH